MPDKLAKGKLPARLVALQVLHKKKTHEQIHMFKLYKCRHYL